MPADTDKHAAAQQAVDILHEISTILVRALLSSPRPRVTNLASKRPADIYVTELPSRSSHFVDLHLDD
jgi:hypothetical protein